MEVPRSTCAGQAFLPPSSLYFIATGADHGFSPPSFDSRVQIRPFRPRHPFISLSRVQIMGFRPRRLIRVCKSGLSAPVVLLIELHGCRLRGFAPVGFHGCCPELRQGPAQLRGLRNSPRTMPLFGLPIIVMTALYTS